MTIHAEMAPRLTFCDRSPLEVGEDRVIRGIDWHTQPSLIQHVDCENCLLKLFMLGDSASIALARMGRKVEVRDDPSSEAVS